MLHVVRQEPALTVKRDGVDVSPAAWGVAIPVDPGTHEIRAEATGFESWTQSVLATSEGQTFTVDVPELHRSPVSSSAVLGPARTATTLSGSVLSPANTASQEGDHPGDSQRIVGLVMGGAGIVAMGAGGILGLVAKAEDDAAAKEKNPARHKDSADASNLADIATVVVVIGTVAGAAGVVAWLTVPKGRAEVGTNGRELFLRARF